MASYQQAPGPNPNTQRISEDGHELEQVQISPSLPASTIGPSTGQNHPQLGNGLPTEASISSMSHHTSPASSVYAEAPPHKGRRRRMKRQWRDSWIPEVLSLVLAGLSLMAICIVLTTTEGKTRPKWFLGISVNALVAIFLVLLKAGLALPLSEGISQLKWHIMASRPRQMRELQDYDEASRGAWGSLQFLFRLNLFDFDVHSVVWYKPWTWGPCLLKLRFRKENLLRYLTKLGALLTVLAFIADPFAQQLVQYVDCRIDDPTVETNLARATIHVRNSGYPVQATPEDRPSIIPAFDSAIIVGTTNPPANIHSLIDVNCPSGNCTFPRFQTLGLCNACQDISDKIVLTREDCLAGSSCLHLYDAQNRSYLNADSYRPLNTTAIPDTADKTFQLTILHYPLDRNSEPFPGLAVSCEVYPCIKEYDSEVRSGELTENLASTIRLEHTWNAPERAKLPITHELPANCSYYPRPSDGSECEWVFKSMYGISMATEQVLGGQTIGRYRVISSSSVQVRRLWNDGDMSFQSVEAFMTDLADVLTATTRNTGSVTVDDEDSSAPVPEPLHGTAQAMNTCIEVQWAWLSFLVAIIGFTLVFWMIFWLADRRHADKPIWKSSDMAVLMCSVDGQIMEELRGYSTRDEMFEVAERTTVQLVPDDQGRPIFEKV